MLAAHLGRCEQPWPLPQLGLLCQGAGNAPWGEESQQGTHPKNTSRRSQLKPNPHQLQAALGAGMVLMDFCPSVCGIAAEVGGGPDPLGISLRGCTELCLPVGQGWTLQEELTG